jgi:hypothetical protein
MKALAKKKNFFFFKKRKLQNFRTTIVGPLAGCQTRAKFILKKSLPRATPNNSLQ